MRIQRQVGIEKKPGAPNARQTQLAQQASASVNEREDAVAILQRALREPHWVTKTDTSRLQRIVGNRALSLASTNILGNPSLNNAKRQVDSSRRAMYQPFVVKDFQIIQRQELASHELVRYKSGERQSSFLSAGTVQHDGTNRHIMANFGVNQVKLKPEHQQLIELLVLNLQLDQELPNGYVRLIEGYTDLVGNETINQSLRTRRAWAVYRAFIDAGAKAANIDVVRAAPPGYLLDNNQSSHGRSNNRAVKIEIQENAAPIQPPRKDNRSREWSLKTVSTFSIGEILGGGGGLFQLKNRKTGEVKDLIFAGAGLAGGLSIPRLTVSLPPSWVDFETSRLLTFRSFASSGIIYFVSADISAVGIAWGYARFKCTMDRRGIPIGGLQGGGLGVSGAIIPGWWVFLN